MSLIRRYRFAVRRSNSALRRDGKHTLRFGAYSTLSELGTEWEPGRMDLQASTKVFKGNQIRRQPLFLAMTPACQTVYPE